MGLKFVEGDEYVEERKHAFIDEAKLHKRLSWTSFALFAALTLIYAVFGGRGWLAGSILSGFLWLSFVVDGVRNASHWFDSVAEHRLRILEEKTERIDAGINLIRRKIDPDTFF